MVEEPPAIGSSPDSGSEHIVMFYDQDQFLVDSVVESVGTALEDGRLGVVVATPEHRAGVEAGLAARGISPRAGLYRGLDARELLSRCMDDGWPSAARFNTELDAALRGATEARPAQVFGEMVALLVADGRVDAAMALESLWNGHRAANHFSLMCAYPMRSFGDPSMASALDEACAAHSAVIPCETYSTLVDEQARLREIALLQQKAAALERALAAEREARAAAEAALRVREEFLFTASHELRTPITILGVQAQLSLRRWQRTGELDTERVVRSLRTIDKQADKVARLVSRLLDVSRLDSGKLSIQPVLIDLPLLISQIVAISQALSDRHQICMDLPEQLECRVDPLRFEQVLMNVLENAIRYSPDGGRIDVSLRRLSSGETQLAVRDFGPGIEVEKRSQIFDRFFADYDLSGRSGLGLGLYLGRSIVELHGGELVAEFPPEGGTRFVIRLPA